MTEGQYLYFELRFEWMAATKANSGVKYRLLGFDRLGGLSREALGFEYQVADDEGEPGTRVDPKQRSGSLYAVTAVERSLAKPVGEWNEGRIVVLPDHVEHWLNGQLTASHATDVPFASTIVLQHHTTEVRFRNIRIKRLGAETAGRWNNSPRRSIGLCGREEAFRRPDQIDKVSGA
jgi:3-keto-disaccharide hydrolase